MKQFLLKNSLCFGFYAKTCVFQREPSDQDRVMQMTKGQVEAKISEAVSKFEIEYMGRGPKQIRTIIIQDLIIVRLIGFLSHSEQKLAESKQGVELIKKLRATLFESARDHLESIIKEIIDVDIISTHSDVSTKTGEKIIVITVGENLEERFSKT